MISHQQISTWSRWVSRLDTMNENQDEICMQYTFTSCLEFVSLLFNLKLIDDEFGSISLFQYNHLSSIYNMSQQMLRIQGAIWRWNDVKI